ncbi:DNA repair protein RecN (Recombination protein N) [Pedobacter cryoconitis]|uniref:DNA repair protein RecN n=1 Tax=Pedobacter cryoconitis TaxID=188932 RepID=A0A7W9DZJ3_9SPHI|nr:DNA repair protein RecN [Pedobacter cryoconitis]MBB5636309.1 DNA repair protein RecN (Recombination protein N) [Pedobacter cryoconitis]MBB6272774.1 DNA repair protein RecN (Recombination protein N) [Pedobacter cryoconitis]
MLQKLSIRNYALIDSVDLELDKGLNIITGETGAGKSIMLGALSLILGQRAETKYFFNQAKKCVIEGQFKLTSSGLQPYFEEFDLDYQQESILRREISIDGKSRAFINDTPVTLAVMKQIGEKLIDIHSQHATSEVNDPGFQLSVVDTLSDHLPLLTQYRLKFREYKKNLQLLINMQTSADEARSKQDYEQFLFNELESANLQPGEQAALEIELEALNHAESIKRGLLNGHVLLDGEETAVLPILKEVINQIQAIEKFSPSYSAMNERLRSALIEIKDIAEETIVLEENIVYSPARIDEINIRLDTIYTLQQKHRVTSVEELLALQNELSDNLNTLLNSDEEIERLILVINKLKIELEKIADTLSKNRSKAINVAQKQVGEILVRVGMPNAKIKIEQTVVENLNKDGKDMISLLFSANAGQAPAPVGKVASGGELSRLMLAIKSIISKHTSLPTLIFDEIDTGISGETALRVGDVIGELEQNMQVICITHLPQIAAKGEAHYFVYKKEESERTTTGIRRLNPQERILAIAEMLSGKNPGESALKNAQDLLSYKN